ncbi:MAG TPA: OsmC family protein [Myxococcota bacterium]|jgi:putative redox protein|nr:OsmC family protein [Myxococcota bacterium]
MREAKVTWAQGADAKLRQDIAIGPHRLVGDEPPENGGDDAGPGPHELLGAALAECTALTLKIYAQRKAWPLEHAEVRVAQEKIDGVHHLHRTIVLRGPLSPEQRARLLDVAGKCPVHRTLTGKIEIDSVPE